MVLIPHRDSPASPRNVLTATRMCLRVYIEDGANTMGASVRLDVGLATINTGLDTQPPSDKRGTTASNFLRTRYIESELLGHLTEFSKGLDIHST